MARELRWWIAAPLVACLAVTLAYVPPRGGVKVPGGTSFSPVSDNGKVARRRAQELAGQWRAVELQLDLLHFRGPVETTVTRHPAAGPTLLVSAPHPIPEIARQRYEATLDSVWHDLGLSVTKVSVAVILELRETSTPLGAQPTPAIGARAYLLPNAADPATCLVLLRSPYRMATSPPMPREAEQIRRGLRYSLGPCAFYGAFGVPSKPVRQWLGRRSYDLAIDPDWTEAGGSTQNVWLKWLHDSTTNRWRWSSLYSGFPWSMSATTLGCLGGRPRACRDAVIEGAAYSTQESIARFVTPSDWWWRRMRLVDGDRYLADVARAVGPERFLQFWTSEDPVDTALSAALKMPVGEWTVRWQQQFVPRLPLGAAAPLTASALGCLLAVAAVASTAVSARRRQAR